MSASNRSPASKKRFELDDFTLLEPLGVGTVGTVYAVRFRDAEAAAHRPAAIDANREAEQDLVSVVGPRRKRSEPVAGEDADASPPVPVAPATEAADDLAVKVLHPGVARDPLVRARFKREIALLSRMQHPNIIASYGGGESRGQLYCVMERVRGGSVAELLEHRGTLPWPTVVSVVRQACSALQCAHNHGVVHRDLKPSNLFLTLDGQVKLGDFGIARDLHSADLSSSGMTVGTHAYMPPEQITGDRSLSGKADLYSLGCCIHEMLTGRPPFAGDNFVQLFEQHLRAKPPRIRSSVPDCPAALEEVVQEMLAKDPRDRPFNARTIQGVMLRIMEEHPAAFVPHEARPELQQSRAAVPIEVTAEDHGRQLLAHHIRQRLGAREGREVSAAQLILVVLIVLAIVTAGVLANL